MQCIFAARVDDLLPNKIIAAAPLVAFQPRPVQACVKHSEPILETEAFLQTCPCTLYAEPPVKGSASYFDYMVLHKGLYEVWASGDIQADPLPDPTVRIYVRVGDTARTVHVDGTGDYVLVVRAGLNKEACITAKYLFQARSTGTCPLRMTDLKGESPKSLPTQNDTETGSRSTLRVIPKIISGSRVVDEAAKQFMVGLYTRGRGACTGTVVGDQWVLTAAHCVPEANKTRLYVGGSEFSAGTEHYAKEVYIHPDFSVGLDKEGNVNEAVIHDIALIRSWRPIGVQPILVNTKKRLVQSKDIVRALGYGLSLKSKEDSRGVLHQVDIPIINFAQCEADYREVSQGQKLRRLSNTKHLCAGPDDVCQGGVCRGELSEIHQKRCFASVTTSLHKMRN